MILAEDLAIMDWNSSINQAHREGKAEGKAEGRAEGKAEGHADIIQLNKWLASQNRSDDIIRYTNDPDYLDTLLKEYESSSSGSFPEI